MNVINTADIHQNVFERIAWSRPENGAQASKVCLLGGSGGHFAKLSSSYSNISQTTGIKLTLLVPSALQKILKTIDAQIIYLPSHPNGGYFVRDGQREAIDTINTADASLIAGDIGRSSESQQFLEQIVAGAVKPIVITPESLDSFATNEHTALAANEHIALTIRPDDFRKIVRTCQFDQAYTSNLTFQQKLELITKFTQKYAALFVILDEDFTFISKNGTVYYTRKTIDIQNYGLELTKWASWNNTTPILTAAYVASLKHK